MKARKIVEKVHRCVAINEGEQAILANAFLSEWRKNETLQCDVRCLVEWVDSVIAGNSSNVEEGSLIDVISRRWRNA
jgi:hypothetical protein